ncbi:MAG TPA: outer membrane beta-barrel protein [Bacteroidales bacterium]|nr:outer membrane beta-barrel protein [Bacteroidales bacterium]
MKRKIVLFIVIFILCGISYGQNFSIGGRAGLNVMPFKKDDLNGQLFGIGGHAGIITSYKINDWFSVSAEALYTSRKKTYELNSTGSFIGTLSANPMLAMLGVDINDILDSLGTIQNYVNDTVYNTTRGMANLGYIKIPILLTFNYESLYFSAGPYISFLVSNKSKESFSQHIPIVESLTGLDTIPFYTSIIDGMFPGYNAAVNQNITGDKNIRKVDFGIMADVSYHLDNNFIIGIRYTQGLLNYRDPEIYKKDYLSSFSFSIGYLFGVSGNNISVFKYE